MPGLVTGELDHLEVAEINREVAMNAHRWTFELPSKNVTRHLGIPPRVEPNLFEEIGSISDQGQDGRLVRLYKPTRWRNPILPRPWPVERWWSRIS
jgi:hypothetical protein